MRKINEKLLDATEQGNLPETKKLLENKQYPVDINYKGLDDWTPLHNVA